VVSIDSLWFANQPLGIFLNLKSVKVKFYHVIFLTVGSSGSGSYTTGSHGSGSNGSGSDCSGFDSSGSSGSDGSGSNDSGSDSLGFDAPFPMVPVAPATTDAALTTPAPMALVTTDAATSTQSPTAPAVSDLKIWWIFTFFYYKFKMDKTSRKKSEVLFGC
jgi:hypothetical protein